MMYILVLVFTFTDETTAWQHIIKARINLAELLDTLNTDQWNEQSMCKDWRIKDVVSHLIIVYNYSLKDLLDFIRSGFNINTFLCNTAIKHSNIGTIKLLNEFKCSINDHHRPTKIHLLNVLADLIIHEQDIRIALNLTKKMPTDSLILIFSHWEIDKFNLGELITGVKGRIKNLEFHAKDIDIKVGDGLIISGAAQDILLAITGRTEALNRLSGSGLGTLRQRMT